MSSFQEEIKLEFERIKTKLENDKPLSSEDLKIILLTELLQESAHDN